MWWTRGFGVSRTVVEKFIRQTVNKLINGFEVKSGV